MSYISAAPRSVLASVSARPRQARSSSKPAGFLPGLLAATTSLVSTGLQATLLLATMSGVSLVLCTIAAGAV